MKNIQIIGGSSHPTLVEDTSRILQHSAMNEVFEYFANSEFRPRIPKSVRGKDIFIIQSHGYPLRNGEVYRSANDFLMESYILARTLKRSDAKTVTLITPFFPYSREDKKDHPRGAISARDVADLFEEAGIDRVVTFDLHTPQIQGFFTIPCDNLYTTQLIKSYLDEKVFSKHKDYRNSFVLVAPDEGAFKRTKTFAELFEIPFLVLSKERDYTKKNAVEKTVLIGDESFLSQRTAIVIDDIIDTFGTINKASEVLKMYGAKNLIVCATHGVFSGPALERIRNNDFVHMVLVSDSIPQKQHSTQCNKIHNFSIAPTIAEVITRLMEGKSLSEMFRIR